MRLLICAGGTGGGVYPALAVLQRLAKDVEVLWVGGEGGMEADLVKRSGVPYTAIPAAGVHGVGLRTLPGNLLRLARGVAASRRILGQFHPDVILFTGGYVAVPMAVAARRTPILLYVPDIEPGLALKTLARFAHTIAITTEASKTYFSAKARTLITGYPTRQELGTWDRSQAREKLNLRPDLPVLLVSGGSKGARSINRALFGALPGLLPTVQVLHISGTLDWAEVETAKASLPAELASNYHAYSYLHEEMGAAFASADLTICRAGASTLGELPLFGLPAILVPYPYAWRYQRVNASYLVEKGAAQMITDDLLAEQLLPTVQTLLQNPGKLAEMRRAMQSLSHPQAAQHLAELIQSLGGKTSPRQEKDAHL